MIKAVPTRPRWLIVVPNIPRPDQAAGDRRLLEVLQMLGTQCELCLIPVYRPLPGDEPYEVALEALGIRVFNCGVANAIEALVRHSFDAVFFEFYYATYDLIDPLRALQPHALVIVDSVDVHYLREREAVRLGTHDPVIAANTELKELGAYRKADVTVAVSVAERSALQQVGVGAIEVIPIIVPIVPRVVRERNPEVLFIGNFHHLPNGFAVEWFHEKVWPLVRQRVPDARWTIAGNNAPPSVAALDDSDGIRVLGFVPSTVPLLESAEVSVAPLTFGGGMKGKVCEALGAGVPVVMTKWGAQGLEAGNNVAFLVEDEPAAFADAVVRVLTDANERQRLSEGGPRLAQQLCSAEAAAPGVAELVRRSRGRRSRLWSRKRIFAFYDQARARLFSREERVPRAPLQ